MSYNSYISGGGTSTASTGNVGGTYNVPAYTTVNLNTGADIGAWRVTLYGKNLNNAHGINFANNTAVAAVPFNAGIIQPRTIGGDVSYRF